MRVNMRNHRTSLRLWTGAALVCLLGAATVAEATRIADVSHLKGRRENTLMGYGLVIGLAGTGDGGKYLPSILQLQSMLTKFNIPVPAAALTDTKNVAIVMIEAILPDHGVREGDRVDVRVNSTGAAKSLAGGYLVSTPLQGPSLDRIFAFATGPVRLPDAKVKTTGLVVGGATMEADVIHNYISEGWQFTLVLEDVHASHALAAGIAEIVNEHASAAGQLRRIAEAMDAKNVVVTIPPEERESPTDFIGRVENAELLMPPGEARVIINRKTSTIVIGDGVEVGAAIIAHNGMSITTQQPPIVPSEEAPVITQEYAVPFNAGPQQGTKLKQLVDSLNALNVPAKDIIEIIENLYRMGKVRGKLVIVE